MSEENVPQLSEVEQQAIEQGWQPKEEFEADPKNEGKRWRSAEDFMDRKPLFDKIDSQSRELKDVKRALQSLAQQNRKIEEFAYAKAMEELRAQKVQALDDGAHDAVMAIDDQINRLNNQLIASSQQAQVQSGPNPDFAEWVEQNKWYVNDKEMRNVADGIGLSLSREGVPPKELMAQVTKRIKDVFPEKFGKSRVPPSPEGGGGRKASGGGSVESLLTPSEQKIMSTIVATGTISKEEYIKQFAAINPERFKGVKL